MNGNALENKPDDYWKSIPYFPGRNPDADFSDAWKHLKKIVTKSHAAHTDPYHYCECAICGFRGKELSLHLKTHRISSDDYKATYNAKVKCDAIADSVKGENNPAFGHGGLYSPFSKKFIKGDVSEATREKSAKTKEEHPDRQPTRIEFYLAKGLSQEEAERALSERQTTFSLEKCVEKYGEDGRLVWEARQEKWMESLLSKSDEELADINLKKIVKNGLISKLESQVLNDIRLKIPEVDSQFTIRDGIKHHVFDFRLGNRLIELNGDFWHANPSKYTRETYKGVGHLTYDVIREKDENRKRFAEANGYELLTVWEMEFRTDYLGSVQKCIDFFLRE